MIRSIYLSFSIAILLAIFGIQAEAQTTPYSSYVVVISTCADVTNYTASKPIIFCTADNKFYYHNGSGWTSEIPSPTFTSKINLPRVTALPGSPSTGDTVVVTDDSAVGACDSAAGSARTLCHYNGSAWQSLGDGGSGGGGGITNSAGNNVVMKSDGTNAVASSITDDGTTVTIGGAGTGLLGLKDTDQSHFLQLTPGSDLTVDRTLTITTGDSDRTLTLTGNATISGTNTGDQTSVTGNAGTATALAANPADCAANNFATTIAANGDLTCAAISDADVPNTITINTAAAATALAANGTNCSAGNYARGIDASGNAEDCTATGGGITNSAGNNVVMKSDGTNAVASSITDNGSIVTSTIPFDSIEFSNSIFSGTGNVFQQGAFRLQEGGGTPSQLLTINAGSAFTVDRTFTLTTGDADRTLTMTGDASISGTNTGDTAITSATTYYVCPSSLANCAYNGDGGQAATPNDSNTCLTKALPCATVAGARDKFLLKQISAPVTIQLADTTGGTAYFPDNVEFSNVTEGKQGSHVLEFQLSNRADTYPTGYIWIRGNDSTPNNVNVTGAATAGGTVSTKKTAFTARGSSLRVSGMMVNYFRTADSDTGAINCYSAICYAETINATSDHTDNDGSLLSGFSGSTLGIAGSMTLVNTGLIRANAKSTWQLYTPAGEPTVSFTHSGTNVHAVMANESSHGFASGGTFSFLGTGTYYAFSAFTASTINFNGDAAAFGAAMNITVNGANITFLHANTGSMISEGCGGSGTTCTFTSMLRRAFARNNSNITYAGTTAGSSADSADNNSCIGNGTFPFTTKLCSVMEGYREFKEISAPSSPAADTIRLYAKDDGGVTKIYTKNSAGTETELGAGGGGSTLPVADTTGIAKGSVDATKIARLEVDGITTGTTRVVTVPNADTTIPIATQQLTFSGPTAARTITFPDANFTTAKTDSNDFTGAQTVKVNNIQPFKIVRTGTGQTQVAITSGGTNVWESTVFNAERWNGSTGTPSTLTDGMDILTFNGAGWQSGAYDGGVFESSGWFTLDADGAHGSGSTPGRWSFATTPSGSVTPVERVRIQANGLTSLYSGAAVASAATITATGNLFHVTGTTNITSVSGTGVTAGTKITIIFDGALTFTDGSNLKLAGNFVTTADDTITLVYDGTNWYETARAVN
jgi:hypothetical protein